MSNSNERPRGLRRIQNIELSEDKAKFRFVLVIVFIGLAMLAFGIFISGLLTKNEGWYTITAETEYINCGSDFVFNYYVGSTEKDNTAEYKEVKKLYGELTVKGYRLFNRYDEFVGVNNVCYINNHPNEIIEIDEHLYKAFEKIIANENRYLYMGALHSEYSALFFGNVESIFVEDKDPKINEEYASYFKKLADYAKDKTAINLELHGENKVKLVVSEEYLNYAKENEITVFIDFFRTKNAFIVDMFAEELNKAGFKKGNLTSCEGYIRNTDESGENYSLNLFNKKETIVYNAAKMNYSKPISIITLRSYSLSETDSFDFLFCTDGRVITPYVDINDGLYKTATSDLYVYSSNVGCADLLIKTLPYYISDSFEQETVFAMRSEGIFSICFDNYEIILNDSEMSLGDLYSDEKITYTKKYIIYK